MYGRQAYRRGHTPVPLGRLRPNQRMKLSWRGRPLEREVIYLDRGRRTTQLMRDSLGSMRPTPANPRLTALAMVRRVVSTLALLLGVWMLGGGIRGLGRWTALMPGGRIVVTGLLLFGAGVLLVALGVQHRLWYTPWLTVPVSVLWLIIAGSGTARLLANHAATETDLVVFSLESLPLLLVLAFVLVRRRDFTVHLGDRPQVGDAHDA
jgi:hypothetical protein